MVAFPLTLTLLAVFHNSHVFGFTAPTTRNKNAVSLSSSSSFQRNFNAKTFVKTPITTTPTTIFSLLGVDPQLPANAVGKDSEGLVAPNSLRGKTMVVIGGSAGMGFASARAFAKGGARVIFTTRTMRKGEKAVEAIKEHLRKPDINVENNEIYVVQLDLDDLDNVKGFPQRLQDALGSDGKDVKIDVLSNNAGVFGIPTKQLTKNGNERTFQSNYLGQFVLVSVLKPLLKNNARIINTSSDFYLIGGRRGGLDLNNLNCELEYGPLLSYGQSHAAKILWTQELQRRADAAGLSWTVNCLHPGIVSTDIVRNFMGGDKEWYGDDYEGLGGVWQNFVKTVMNATLLSPEQGAGTQVYLAVVENEEKGRYYSDLKPMPLLPFATDEDTAKKLWEITERLAGIKFSL